MMDILMSGWKLLADEIERSEEMVWWKETDKAVQ